MWYTVLTFHDYMGKDIIRCLLGVFGGNILARRRFLIAAGVGWIHEYELLLND
jgi:hypothetical protein